MILFPFDIEQYTRKCRGLHFPYAEAMQGEVVNSFEELLRALEDAGKPSQVAAAHRQRYWGNYNGHASEQLARHLIGPKHPLV